MKVVIRTDSSFQIGTGHVMRCLALAQQLQAHGAEVTFVCRDLPGNIFSVIQDKGFKLMKLAYRKDIQQELNSLPEHQQWLGEHLSIEINTFYEVLNAKRPIDLLVVDHYALDEFWETAMRPLVIKIMVIDDLADRKHDCHVLLDQNFFLNTLKRYNNKVPESCKLLLGSKYTLLRREFSHARQFLKDRAGKLENIVISMGGSDPNNLTAKLVDILIEYQREENNTFCLRIIVGPANKNFYCSDLDVNKNQIDILKAPTNMAEQFVWADLCIGTSGSTNWERCALGLPAIVIIDGDNERQVAENLHEAGVLLAYENNNSLKDNIKKGLSELSGQKLKMMSELAMNIADGSGVSTVTDFITKELSIACQTQ